MSSPKMKILSSLVLFSLVLSLVSPALLYPKKASAFIIPNPFVFDIPHTAATTSGWLKDAAKAVWDWVKKHAAAVFYKNSLRIFLSRIAQDTATYIATGGKGQGPLFITSKDYWKRLGDDVLGTFINDLARESGFTDQNLCDPINLQTKLRILISLGTPQGPRVECSLSQIAANLREASQQKLFDFRVDLSEGPVAQYKSYFSIQVSIDTVLKDPVKRRFIRLGGITVNIHDAVLALLNRVSVGKAQGAEKEMAKLRERLNQELIGGSPPNPLNPDYLTFWTVQPARCLEMKQDNICDDVTCLTAAGYKNKTECLNDSSQIRQKLQHADTYAKKLNDWVWQLDSKMANLNLADLTQAQIASLKDLQKQFDPSVSNVGVFLNVKEGAAAKVSEEIGLSKFWESLQGEVQGITSKISGAKKTPGAATKGALEQMLEKSTGVEGVYTGDIIADTIGIFVNTLIAKLYKRIFEKGLNPRETAESGTTGALELGIRPGRVEAQLIFADLAAVSLIKGQEFNILNDFTVCPTETKYALPNNCVMDTDLARAVEEKMTIGQAMEKNLFHPDWLVASRGLSDAAQDYTSRYSLTNIKKMRRARIVPLGLEIAAEKISRGELGDRPVTLKEIVDGFNQYGQDKKCGTSDKGESPFCNLVDPGWVLKAPAFQCGAMGYSALSEVGSVNRQETCLDYKDCVSEDNQGNCQTWGYCVREKNIWSFEGDQCLPQYASCQTYERADGEEFSYLKDSLDFRNCDASQAGCGWYCRDWDKNLGDLGNWNCLQPGKSFRIVNNQKQEFTKTDNAIFFNQGAEACQAQSEGCWQFIRTKEGLGTNLLVNGGFEDFLADQNGNLTEVKGWQIEGGQFLIDQRGAKNGQTVAALNQKNGGAIYVLGIPLLEKTRYTFSVWVNNLDNQPHTLTLKNTQGSISSWQVPAQSSWQRIAAGFFNQEARQFDLVWRLTDDNDFSTGKFVYLDDLQFETGAGSSPNKVYGSANLIYLKKAPSYLDCQPDSAEPKCFDYALYCRAEENGCELYSPVNQESPLTGVAKEIDFCPKECAGYQDFRQAASNFDQSQGLVSFIPRTAKTCPVQAKGCAEFTNLDEVAKGGEGKEYYTYLRQCAKLPAEEASCQYYFTWIGSETAGYQLKRYQLKRGADNGPALVPNPSLDLGQCENENDAIINPHCKQFYDAEGKVYYRIYENTITCSEDCHPYRKTEPAILDVNEVVCGEVGGQWVDGQCQKTNFMAVPLEGITCQREQNGCEEYKGSTANNLKYLFDDNFEGGTVGDWGPAGSVSLTTESIKQGGHSLRISQKAERTVSGLIGKEKTYLLSFWVKGTSQISARFKSGLNFGQLNLPAQDWYSVTLGPVNFDREPDSDEKIILTGQGNFYIDNVVLKEITQSLYLIKNSWQTPAVCDQDSAGNPLVGAMIGCQQYRDRFGKDNYLKSFTRLCPERAVGCEAMIDTQNSSSAFEEKFNQPSPDPSPYDNLTVLADQFVYLVNDPLKACPAQDKGCQKFGQPKIDLNGQAIDYQTVYFKNDPDLYQKKPILCQTQGLGCQAFRPTNSQTPVYFHDPGEKLCQYREKVLISGQYRSGWFKNGTDEPCDPNYLIEGVYGLRLSSDPNYQGWVGLCPADQSTCTKFIDPIDSGPSKEYYYLNNDRLDRASCQGQVSLKQGCILLRDTSITDSQNRLQLYWNSQASYLKSEKATPAYSLVTPVDCQKNPEDQYCQEVQGGIISPSPTPSPTSSPSPGQYVFTRARYGYLSSTSIADCAAAVCQHMKGCWWSNVDGSSHLSYQVKKSNSKDWNIVKAICNYLGLPLPSGDFTCNRAVGDKELTGDGKWDDEDDKIACGWDYSECSGTISPSSCPIGEGSLKCPGNSLCPWAVCRKVKKLDYCPGESGGATANDSNLILKVKPERTCAQWLSCPGGVKTWDKNTGQQRLLCDQLERCQKSAPQTGQTSQTEFCLETAEPGYDILTEAVYKARDVSWKGLDYSGYSLYNFPPIEKMVPTSSGLSGGGQLIPKTCRAYPEASSPFSQSARTNYPEVNFCQLTDGNQCLCDYTKAQYGGVIRYYPIDAGQPPSMTCDQEFHKDCGDCSAPPKGPFELCSECDNLGSNEYPSRCDYCQVDKSDRTSSGAEDCSECVSATDCGTNKDEKCVRCDRCTRRAGPSENCPLSLNSLTDYLGWYGYCLEPDLSKPAEIQSCLTWYPADLFPGIRGFYDWDESAGYRAPLDRQWYCLKPLRVRDPATPPCFTGKTLILMADGSNKKIEEIKAGEMVLTRESEGSAKLVPAKILKKLEHLTDNYLIINDILEVTPDHRMFVNGQWKAVRDIKIGDKIFNQNNQPVAVKSIKSKKEQVKVYNLEIEKYQTYFADGFYVHNRKAEEPPNIREK